MVVLGLKKASERLAADREADHAAAAVDLVDDVGRRAKKPFRTASASGISGCVPYIAHSTRPTSRPFESATRNPGVWRSAEGGTDIGATVPAA